MNKIISPYSSELFSNSDSDIPPEVVEKINPIIDKIMKKIEPELKEITKIFKLSKIKGAIQFGVSNMLAPKLSSSLQPNGSDCPIHSPQHLVSIPNTDLVLGIKKILDLNYTSNKVDILGVEYDVNHNTALSIAEILNAARKRDQKSLALELEILINKLK